MPMDHIESLIVEVSTDIKFNISPTDDFCLEIFPTVNTLKMQKKKVLDNNSFNLAELDKYLKLTSRRIR